MKERKIMDMKRRILNVMLCLVRNYKKIIAGNVFSKNIYRKIVGIICLSILFCTAIGSRVSAKDYYDKKYNSYAQVPYKKVNKKIAFICMYDIDKQLFTHKNKDLNGDGKKDKMVLSINESDGNKTVKIKFRINEKTAINTKITEPTAGIRMIGLSTMKIQGKCMAALIYGDESYACGGAQIYLWKNNGKLKLLKSYKAKGYLDIYVAEDSKLNKSVLFIQDAQQLSNHYGEKWPSNVMKRYKKYAKDKHASVTKTTYYKFVYKNGGLKNVGKDNYYRVGQAYD